MSAVRIMTRRTLGALGRSGMLAVATALFLACASARFLMALHAGGTRPVAALWAEGAFPLLPLLAAFATMRLWSALRADGRLDLLLTAPVLERDLVFGKFMGSWMVSALAILLYAVVPLVLLPWGAPAFSPRPGMLALVPGMVVLSLQAALWTALGICASAVCRSAAGAAVGTVLLALGLPAAAWWCMEAWCPAGRWALNVYPLLAQVRNGAAGRLELDALVLPIAFTGAFLFITTKVVLYARLAGRGWWVLRLSTYAAAALALVFAGLLHFCAVRLDWTANVSSLVSPQQGLSPRTRAILASLDGTTEVTCFLSRRAPDQARAMDVLQTLKVAIDELGGGRSLVIRSVDPLLDLSAAVRLRREGCAEGSLVFRRGRRTQTVMAATADAATCAAAMLRLVTPSGAGTVYWTTGHGEALLDATDAYGMSDFARELRRAGHRLAALDVAAAPSLPDDCRLLVVAGARTSFSQAEKQRVEGYLNRNGRLLVLADATAHAGVTDLLPAWGVKVLPFAAVSPHTVTGGDLPVTTLADHVVTRPLRGCTLLFGAAAPLEDTVSRASAATDRLKFTALATTDEAAWGEADIASRPWSFDPGREPGGPLVLAAALERGGNLGASLAYRPTRIVVVGDAAFGLNGALAERANANRAFLLNAVAWLVGQDAFFGDDVPPGTISTGLARSGWVRLAVLSALAMPFVVFVLLLLPCLWYRRRGLSGESA